MSCSAIELSTTASDADRKESEPPVPEGGLMRRLSKAISHRLSFSRGSNTTAWEDEEIPANFLRVNSSRPKAGRKWEVTRRWRLENDVDHILVKPHPNYSIIKTGYPQYFHGRAINGDIVSIEQPGNMNLKELKKAGIGPKELAMHLAFTQEFLWARVLTGDDGRVVTIMDVAGLSLSKLSTDLLAIIKATGDVLNNHYPDRVSKILVVNAPRFVAPVLGVLKTILPSPLKDQLEICRSVSDLEKFIDINVIPTEYGGKSPYKLGESQEEKALNALVEQLNTTASS